MDLNLLKSNALLNSRKDILNTNDFPIRMVSESTILGVKLTKDLRWDAYVEYITERANQRFHTLRILKRYLNPPELHLIYTAHIRSILEYASPVYVHLNAKLNNKLEKVDRRAHHLIFGNQPRNCKCPKKDCLKVRRENSSMVLFNKIVNDEEHLLHNKAPKRFRHKQNLFSSIYCRTNKRQRSFFPHATELYNTQQHNLIDTSLASLT